MTTEERQAWQGFAEAALNAIILGTINNRQVVESKNVIWLAELAANSADAMMEQRKARL